MNPNSLDVCNINVIKKSFEKYFDDREKWVQYYKDRRYKKEWAGLKLIKFNWGGGFLYERNSDKQIE